PDPEPQPPQHARREYAEKLLFTREPLVRLEDADARLDLLPRRLPAKDALQAFLQRPDVRLEQARLQLREQRLHRKQRMRFVGRKPQARQLVARPLAWLAEAVPVRRAVVL